MKKSIIVLCLMLLTFGLAAQDNGKVLNASVSIKMAICPECGRSYVAGGLTRTTIKYSNEENPYQKNMKQAHKALLSGMNFEAST